MAQSIVGSVSWQVFIGLICVVYGWICYMAATALAKTWRPWWSNIFYGIGLAASARMFEAMLFRGELLSLKGFVVDFVVLEIIMLLSYRVALTSSMVTQYPWLYERSSPFGWREKPAGSK